MLGLISLALALLNLLPLLPLDGGHIVISLLERVRGRAFSQRSTSASAPSASALFLFLCSTSACERPFSEARSGCRRLRCPEWAATRSVSVGGVTIGGGAPVVVQSMTLTKTHDVEATTAQIAALAERGLRDRPRRRAEARGRRGAAEDRALLADPGDRRHPLQREPRAEGDRGGRRRRPDQPRQHRRRRQGRARSSRRRRRPGSRCGSAPTPARCRSTSTTSPRTTRPRRSSRPRSRRCGCSRGSTSATSRSPSSRATCRR